MNRIASALAALCTVGLLITGCTTVPPAPLSRDAALVSGRFGLKASFLPEASQGRFEWRSAQQADHEVWILDPWGQLQGVFRRSASASGPWAGWSLSDARGRSILPETQAASATAKAISPEGLQALAEMLDSLGERFRQDRGSPEAASPRPFTLRGVRAGHWIELRIAPDAH
ncbi:MAG: hypothetical protein RLZZ344_24 [Pseudomonadota bacterium]